MEMFSTELYVNGLPVDYNVTAIEKSFVFEPTFNPHEDVEPPSFKVLKEEEQWVLVGVIDDTLKEQVLEEISHYLKNEQSDD
ncbi:MAG TPA: hypothetical protein VEZ55_12390 [Chitinophagaceae bacterium]|nr:hypothetical protein [Chitinophagaceae bacterium]